MPPMHCSTMAVESKKRKGDQLEALFSEIPSQKQANVLFRVETVAFHKQCTTQAAIHAVTSQTTPFAVYKILGATPTMTTVFRQAPYFEKKKVGSDYREKMERCAKVFETNII